MNPYFLSFIKSVLLPPGLQILLLLLALFVIRWSRKLTVILILISTISLYFLATPYGSQILISRLESVEPLDISSLMVDEPTALVVLGCGRYTSPPEYSEDDISDCGLIRLRYAAEIYHHKKIPVLLSGGSVYGEEISEAEIMQNILENLFQIKATWIEKNSINTIENAKFSSRMLNEQDIAKIVLVTHASHMHRARDLFMHENLKVIPAPTYYFSSNTQYGLMNLIPSAYHLSLSSLLLKEYLGIAFNIMHRYLLAES